MDVKAQRYLTIWLNTFAAFFRIEANFSGAKDE